MTSFAIKTDHLRKEYGPKAAVEDLTLTVPHGEVFGFLGPNGAGKSTTVKMLLGLVSPTNGQASLFGRSPRDSAARAKVGFLPEHFRFHEWLKADEFLTVHGRLYGIDATRLKRRVPELLELVGLQTSARARLSTFSKGMLQRVGLAQAMLNNPDLIFLDEPTSGLDPLGRRLVRRIIGRLREAGTTVFLNSHLLSEVELTCDRVAFIKRGRVLRTDAMADLRDQSTDVLLQVDDATPTLLTALEQLGTNLRVEQQAITLTVSDDEHVADIAALVQRQGRRLYALTPRRQSLEDLFVSIIGSDETEGGAS